MNLCHTIILVACLCLIPGCSTTNSGFTKPDLSKIEVGMSKPEVIEKLGQPDSTSTSGQTEYLEYGWDKFMDGLVGAAETFYVKISAGHVESFGRKGDFNTTKNPTVDLNINQRTSVEGGGAPPTSDSNDLFTRLKKLQQLKDDGLLTDEEFERLRKQAVAESR